MSKPAPAPSKIRRSQGRMLALQALCAFEALGDDFNDQLNDFLRDEETLTELAIPSPPHPDVVRFARTLSQGAWAQHQTLDERISATATHWSLHRMPPVDRNILRLGVHELWEHADTPPPVVVSEAVELARRFGDGDSAGFVNGVLDAIRRGAASAPARAESASTDAQPVPEEGPEGAAAAVAPVDNAAPRPSADDHAAAGDDVDNFADAGERDRGNERDRADQIERENAAGAEEPPTPEAAAARPGAAPRDD